MKELNDINSILVFYMRKIKQFLIIVFLCIFAFATVKAVNIIPKYMNQPNEKEIEKKDSEAQNVEQEEPTLKTVTIPVRISPKIVNGVDETQYIANAYIANAKDESIVNGLLDKYLQQEKDENKSNRELLYSYGYILDKERNYNYNETDFTGRMSVTLPTDSLINNYVLISFTSMNENLAKNVASDYEKLLTEVIKKQVGTFEYAVESRNIEYKLPTVSAGASATRVLSITSSSGQNRITMMAVMKDIIKGVVWGTLLGIVFAVLVLAVWYLTTSRVQKVSDVNTDKLDIIGIVPAKKRKFKFWRTIIYNLEGEKRIFNRKRDIINFIVANIEQNDVTGKIILGGSIAEKSIEKIYNELNTTEKDKFVLSKCILMDADSVRECKTCTNVILVEQIGRTCKQDIDREVNVYEGFNVNVMGVILMD